jgi:hypothetical protein
MYKATQLVMAMLLMAGTALADDAVAPPESMCGIVKQLVAGHHNGFKELRGNHANTRYGDIWKAKYDVIGKDCEIWRSGNVKTHYVCTRSAPSKEVADDYYNEARQTLRECLDKDWSETDAPRKLATGVKATFSRPGEQAAIEIHEIKVDGIFKDQWTIYYIVGEPTEKL